MAVTMRWWCGDMLTEPPDGLNSYNKALGVYSIPVRWATAAAPAHFLLWNGVVLRYYLFCCWEDDPASITSAAGGEHDE